MFKICDWMLKDMNNIEKVITLVKDIDLFPEDLNGYSLWGRRLL